MAPMLAKVRNLIHEIMLDGWRTPLCDTREERHERPRVISCNEATLLADPRVENPAKCIFIVGIAMRTSRRVSR